MSAPVLVCFAVPQEAKPFRRLVARNPGIIVIITGMGARNAARALSEVFDSWRPARVFACGFAGALNPELRLADVVFEAPDDLRERLLAAGAKAGRIHSASRVAITRKEKSELRTTTGADVVDMESAAIREACAGVNIPCACVRAISDTAQENLPFDFNGLMTPDQRFSYRRLFLAMMQNPFAVPALARLGNNSALAAEKLAQVLKKVI